MKFFFLLFFLFTQLLFSLELTKEELSYLKEKKTIKLNVEKDWAPYNFIKNNQETGFINDYLKLIEKKLPVKFEFVKNRTWNEYLKMLENKEIDIISNITITPKREKLFSFTKNSIFTIKMAILSKYDFSEIKDLNYKKVGVIKGYYIVDILKKNYPKINLVTFNNSNELLQAVLNNKVEASIDDHVVFKNFLEKYLLTDDIYNNIILNNNFSKPLYMASNKKNEILVKILDKASLSLSPLKLEKLKHKWNLSHKYIFQSQKLLSKNQIDFLNNNKFNVYITNWEPISIINKNSQIKAKGIALEYFEELTKDLPIKYNYILVDNFTNVLEKLKNDPYGLTLSTSKTKDKEEYASFTKVYNSFPIAIKTKEDKPFIANLKELKNKKIAVGKNFTAHKILSKNYPNLELVLVNNT